METTCAYEYITGPGEAYTTNSADTYEDHYAEVDVVKLNEAFEKSFKTRNLASYSDIYGLMTIEAPKVCTENGKLLTYGTCSGDEVYLLWRAYTATSLDKSTEKELRRYIESQCSDGWGEGFEQNAAYTYNDIQNTVDSYSGEEVAVKAEFYLYFKPYSLRGFSIELKDADYASVFENTKKKSNKKKRETMFTVRKDVRVNNVILEKGDRIQLLSRKKESKLNESTDFDDLIFSADRLVDSFETAFKDYRVWTKDNTDEYNLEDWNVDSVDDLVQDGLEQATLELVTKFNKLLQKNGSTKKISFR